MAPELGLEPRTCWLTASRTTIVLPGNDGRFFVVVKRPNVYMGTDGIRTREVPVYRRLRRLHTGFFYPINSFALDRCATRPMAAVRWSLPTARYRGNCRILYSFFSLYARGIPTPVSRSCRAFSSFLFQGIEVRSNYRIFDSRIYGSWWGTQVISHLTQTTASRFTTACWLSHETFRQHDFPLLQPVTNCIGLYPGISHKSLNL